jgi:hypothetical protein
LIPVLAGPEDWEAPATCAEQNVHFRVRDVILPPKSTTQLRMILYAGEVREGNERAMANIDKTIPTRMQDKCELQVNVEVGNGGNYPLTVPFNCSQLPGPMCH